MVVALAHGMPRKLLFVCLALTAPGCTDPEGGDDGGGGDASGSATMGDGDGADGVDGDGDGEGGTADGDGGTVDGDTQGSDDGEDVDDADGGSDDTDGGSDDGPTPLCGNGELDPGEECDDANTDDNDWCTSACVQATCGDSIVWDAAETCDDGNRQDGDGCAANCVLESCGDGVVDPGEQCDLGPNNGAHGALCSEACVSAGLAVDAEQSFDLEVENNRGRSPEDVKVADFNGDGRADVVTANRVTGGSTVTYGKGDGTLWTPFSMATNGTHPIAVATADFDGDGRLDLATVSENYVGVSVLRGGGQAFEAPVAVPLSVTASSVATGDVDGDGDADIVVANPSASSITLVLNDGDGEFSPGNTASTAAGGGGLEPQAVAVGDVSGDGIEDIVTANAAAADVTVFVGLGDGAFAIAQVYSVGGDALSDVVLADLDDDGRLDVLATAPTGQEVSVLLAGADGELGVANDYPVDGDFPEALAVGDLDGDGALDIVTADAGSDSVSVLFGIPGGGAFELAEAHDVTLDDVQGVGSTQSQMGRDPNDVVVVDLDADGNLDIVTGNGDSKDLAILLGDGAGGFSEPDLAEYLPSYRSRNVNWQPSLAAGDFDDDGRVDLVIADASIDVIAGAGDGRLLPAITYETGGSSSNSRFVGVGDLDGDDTPDFVVSRGFQDGHRTGRRLPSGAFYSVVTGSGGDAYAAAIADIDGDGAAERFFGGSGSVVVFPSDGSTYSLATGGSAIEGLIAADVTGDGVIDLLTTNSTTDEVVLLAGTGTEAWGGANPISTTHGGSGGLGPQGLVLVELNGDEHLDIVTANADSDDLSILLGLGNGAFAEAVGIDFGLGGVDTTRVASGDFNGDLVADIATVGPEMSSVVVAIGFGNGSFAEPQTYDLDVPAYGIDAADLDGDGIDDLVVTGADAVVTVVSAGHTVL